MSLLATLLHLLVLLALPPLMLGVVVKTKAFVAGRRGPPVLQPYRDIAKLLRKGAVYSRTTTALFRLGPIVALAAAVTAGLVVPLGRSTAPLAFDGDVVLFAYVLAAGRFATVLAALDAGSSFEGMGASREVTFSTLAEPVLFLSLGTLALATRTFSLSAVAVAAGPSVLVHPEPQTFLIGFSLLVVVLAENSRVPFDDPATHLELTMVHEVMVLDHGGPDLAYVLYGSAVKLLVTAALVVVPFLPPATGVGAVDAAVFVVGGLAFAVVVGLIESIMARQSLARVPLVLLGAMVVSALAVVMTLSRRG